MPIKKILGSSMAQEKRIYIKTEENYIDKKIVVSNRKNGSSNEF
jgi:hypothetical protein